RDVLQVERGPQKLPWLSKLHPRVESNYSLRGIREMLVSLGLKDKEGETLISKKTANPQE
ncbi:hypothetical protein OAG13_04440, partial [Akkermansiaceae bacterium]|nr:hypothetical protein [Akkermansiaceae bacterium]